MGNIRVGLGYDVHALKKGRDLVLGGVHVPFEKGLDGHSDADVLVHAVMDAILGAMSMGDIGQMFPDTDVAYLGANSMWLLGRVVKLMDQNGYRIGNLDAVLIAQRPKVAPYVETMRRNLADALGCDISDVNVKATTEENLGFTGRGEGMAAEAVALLEKK